MQSRSLKADSLLLLTSLIWGFAFVAQREGMKSMEPFAFNGIRFLLGSLVLAGFILIRFGKNAFIDLKNSSLLKAGLILGLLLFTGASLQQLGIVHTTAGKAGFITGLYVVFVPLLGLIIRQKTGIFTWIGAMLAVAGLYLLSIKGLFTVEYGDFLVFLGAIVWAVHVLAIGKLAPAHQPYLLALMQYFICGLFSLIIGFSTETVILSGIQNAALPIAYGGFLSVGIAYTLQIYAQKIAKPSHAAILLSLEAVFAAIGGWLVLHEILTIKELSGCLLMICGMFVAQLKR